MTPTKRIAREIAGQDPGTAYRDLVAQCFTPAEAAEIVAGTSLALQRTITVDVVRIEDQITDTINLSIKLGQRKREDVNG